MGFLKNLFAPTGDTKKFSDAHVAYKKGDYATALVLFYPLAEQGHANAQTCLGAMYHLGRGVTQNYAEAVNWWRKAAEQGHPAAQRGLGTMYEEGWGVPQDNVRALMWFNLSAAQGDQDAVKNRDSVAQRMTSAQIAEAQKLATEGEKPDHRNSTDAELNAIFVPLRDRVLDFKDATKISWLVILPAMNIMSARLLVKSRGLENTRRFYAHILAQHGPGQVPSGAILGVTTPSSPPEHLAQANELLWKIANDLIAKGYPIEHIAQAFGGFVAMIGEKAVDALYVTTLMVETNKELQSNDFV